jgi:hypothetical protein
MATREEQIETINERLKSQKALTADQAIKVNDALKQAEAEGDNPMAVLQAANEAYGTNFKSVAEFGRRVGTSGNVLKGIPVLGEWADEISGLISPRAEKYIRGKQAMAEIGEERAPIASLLTQLTSGAAVGAATGAGAGGLMGNVLARTGNILPSAINVGLGSAAGGAGISAAEQMGRDREVTFGETAGGAIGGLLGGLGGLGAQRAGRWLAQQGADTMLGRRLGLPDKFGTEQLYAANVDRAARGGVPQPAAGEVIPFEQAGTGDYGLVGAAISSGARDPDILIDAATNRIRNVAAEKSRVMDTMYGNFRQGGDLRIDKNWHNKLRTEATWRALKEYRTTHPEEAMDLANDLGFNLDLEMKSWDSKVAFTDISKGRMPTSISRDNAESLRSMLASRVEPEASPFKKRHQAELADRVIDALPDQPGKQHWRGVVDQSARIFDDVDAMTQRITGKKIDELVTKAGNAAENRVLQEMPGDPYQRLMYRLSYVPRVAAKSLYESQRPVGTMSPTVGQAVLNMYSRPGARIEQFMPAGEQLARRRGIMSGVLAGAGLSAQPLAATSGAAADVGAQKVQGLLDRLNPSP